MPARPAEQRGASQRPGEVRSLMPDLSYRAPTGLELEFLRVATHGFSELSEQIESCAIADYDPTGWCYVRATAGPPSRTANPHKGPDLKTGDPSDPFVQIILWTNDAGMLNRVEIVDYGLGPSLENPYQVFVGAAKNGCLEYPVKG